VRSALRRTAVALAAALVAVGTSPLPASAVGTLTTVCEGTVSGLYSPALQPTPSLVPVTLTVGPSTISCAGPNTHSVTISVSGDQLAGASCTGPVAFVGGGKISTDTVPQTSVQWAAAGTALAQTWVFSDVGGAPPLTVEAAGTAAVLDPGTATACLSGGVSTVTFTAVLVVLA